MFGSTELPAVPTWPGEPYEGEPAHGYFVRLAAHNDQVSTRVFATSLGLNGRNVVPEEMLEFLTDLPIANKERLTRWTPIIRNNSVFINGQEVGRQYDWSIKQPRVCPACLAEARFHRVWWDLTFMTRCPLHGQSLISDWAGSKLAWWLPAIGVTEDGSELAKACPSVAPQLSVGTLLLSRWRLLSTNLGAIFETASVRQIISASEALGGYSPKIDRPTWSNWRANREARIQHGFELLCGSADDLDEFLRSTHMRAHEGGHLTSRYGSGSIGDVRARIERLGTSSATVSILAAVDRVAGKLNVHFGVVRRASYSGAEIKLTLQQVADRLKMGVPRLRRIAEPLQLMPSTQRKNVTYLFDLSAIDKIEAAVSNLARRKQAAAILGVSLGEFDDLVATGGISPFIRRTGKRGWNSEFLKSDLVRFRDHLHSNNCGAAHNKRETAARSN